MKSCPRQANVHLVAPEVACRDLGHLRMDHPAPCKHVLHASRSDHLAKRYKAIFRFKVRLSFPDGSFRGDAVGLIMML